MTQRIEIGGMSCGHCVLQVRRALESVDGVEVEAVEVGQAVVSMSAGEGRREAVVEAIRAAGYAVR